MTNAANTSNPRFAITMGDPAGIGPEIALKALCSPELPAGCDIFIIGDFCVLEQASVQLARKDRFHVMSSIDDFRRGCVNVLDMKQITLKDFTVGKTQRRAEKHRSII